MNKWISSIISFFAGCLLILGFSPVNWSLCGLVAPAILLFLWLRASPLQALWYGLFFGIGFFGMGTSWVYISINQFGNATPFLAGLITTLFTIVLGLFIATQGYVFSLLFNRKSDHVKCLIAFPAIWVIWEGARSLLFTGFPWLLLGYTQTNTLFNAYAPLLSVYGISLVVAIVAGAIVFALVKRNLRSLLMSALVVLVLVIAALTLHQHAWTRTDTKSFSVALVQGNIPQDLKWNPDSIVKNIGKYVDATEPYWGHDIIVWPEAAIPVLASQAQFLINKLDKSAKEHNSALLFGIPTANKNHSEFYNSILVVGRGSGKYDKRHLVPFGEDTPWGFKKVMQYFQIPMSNLSPGQPEQKHLNIKNIDIAAFICYEMAYVDKAFPYMNNSQLLITINDDSWFGNSLAPWQQVQMAQMRALESGRYMLYSSNTGITAIINPVGKIIKQAPQNKLRVLTGTVHAVNGSTPLMRYWLYPLMVILLIFVLGGLLSRKNEP